MRQAGEACRCPHHFKLSRQAGAAGRRPQTLAVGMLLAALMPAAVGRASETKDFAMAVCAAPTSRIEAMIDRFAARRTRTGAPIDAAILRKVVTAYHPASRDANGALGLVASPAETTPRPTEEDLGAVEAWSQVKPQTPELRAHALGNPACAAPVARFTRGAAHLSFVATAHVEREPALRGEVFRAIKAELDRSNPGAVVVEGFPESFPCDFAVALILTPQSQIRSEPDYTARLALERGIPVLGGEPRDLGLPDGDRDGFLILRMLADVSMHGLSPHAAFTRAQTLLGPDVKMSYDGFQAWYRRANGRDFKVDDAWTDITPTFNRGGEAAARGTNRMADAVDAHRDANVTQLIRRALLLRGRVLVEYGSDHFPRQLPVFERAFGRCAAPVARCSPARADSSGVGAACIAP